MWKAALLAPPQARLMTLLARIPSWTQPQLSRLVRSLWQVGRIRALWHRRRMVRKELLEALRTPRKQLGMTMLCTWLAPRLIMNMSPHPGVRICRKRLVLCPLARARLSPLPRFCSRCLRLPWVQQVRPLRCTVVLVRPTVLLSWRRPPASRTFIETLHLPLCRKVCTPLIVIYMSQGGRPGAKTMNLLFLTWQTWSEIKNPWVVPVTK